MNRERDATPRCPVCDNPESLCQCNDYAGSRLALKLATDAEGANDTVRVKMADLVTVCERSYEWMQHLSTRSESADTINAEPQAGTHRPLASGHGRPAAAPLSASSLTECAGPNVSAFDCQVHDPRKAPRSSRPFTVPKGLIDALRSQKQCDPDGVECQVSRQAVDEACAILEQVERGGRWCSISYAHQPHDTCDGTPAPSSAIGAKERDAIIEECAKAIEPANQPLLMAATKVIRALKSSAMDRTTDKV